MISDPVVVTVRSLSTITVLPSSRTPSEPVLRVPSVVSMKTPKLGLMAFMAQEDKRACSQGRANWYSCPSGSPGKVIIEPVEVKTHPLGAGGRGNNEHMHVERVSGRGRTPVH